jgi:hypothetical protein
MIVPPFLLVVNIAPGKINRIRRKPSGLAKKNGDVSNVPRLRLDKTGPAAYDAAIMDSLNDPRIAVAALSSRLWNWWAVPTAR